MTLKEQTESFEKEHLSPYARCSCDTLGRKKPVTPCSVRTEFQRDRDRIVHCKSFRRLKHKTQVFLSPQGDHYRTRLTHTLEVSQIARTISRALRLNEDLTEAIAMGHDLGHTPFGHTGESMLDELVPGGFSHNVQSLRVVELLENGGLGLNLTEEVRDGILHHKKDGDPMTLEGRVVSLADRIAYVNHDIDDAIRAKILNEDDLPEECVNVLGHTHGERINNIILDLISNSLDKNELDMSDEFSSAFSSLRDFMFENVYLNSAAKVEEKKAKHVISSLFGYYLENIDRLTEEFTRNAAQCSNERVVADWIACMTDRYAINEYLKLFVPREWS